MLLAVWLVRGPDAGQWSGWFILVASGTSVLVSGRLLLRPQRLKLDAQGFTLSGGLVRSPRKVRWCDMKGFIIYRLPRGNKMIGYNFVQSARPRSLLGLINHGFGIDATVPKGWPDTLEATVAELNAYRAAAMARNATPPA